MYEYTNRTSLTKRVVRRDAVSRRIPHPGISRRFLPLAGRSVTSRHATRRVASSGERERARARALGANRYLSRFNETYIDERETRYPAQGRILKSVTRRRKDDSSLLTRRDDGSRRKSVLRVECHVEYRPESAVVVISVGGPIRRESA